MTYAFRVEARNEFGYSVPSNSISILCAAAPSTVTNVATANQDDTVVFSWDPATANGLPVTSYDIKIR